jgi:hypothetical protein
VADYLMELYLPGKAADERLLAAARAEEGADQAPSGRVEVRYLGSIFIPSDETCFHLFDAHSRRAVEEASERASIRFERIVASVRLGPSDVSRAERRFGGRDSGRSVSGGEQSCGIPRFLPRRW